VVEEKRERSVSYVYMYLNFEGCDAYTILFVFCSSLRIHYMYILLQSIRILLTGPWTLFS
jgi:hypothetical protein